MDGICEDGLQRGLYKTKITMSTVFGSWNLGCGKVLSSQYVRLPEQEKTTRVSVRRGAKREAMKSLCSTISLPWHVLHRRSQICKVSTD